VREIKDRHLPPRRGRLNNSYCSRRSAIRKFRFSSHLSSPLSVPNFPPVVSQSPSRHRFLLLSGVWPSHVWPHGVPVIVRGD
jgi:hypothetical protein